jgi:hypothetical protein
MRSEFFTGSGKVFFSSPHSPNQLPGPRNQWVPGVLSSVVKRPERETDDLYLTPTLKCVELYLHSTESLHGVKPN